MLSCFTFHIGDHHLVLYRWEQKSCRHKIYFNSMYCIIPIDIMNICSATDKTGIGLFPDSANGKLWGHTCSVSQLCFIQPLSTKSVASSSFLKMVFLFRLPRRSHSSLRIRDKDLIFQIPNTIWKKMSIIISILQMGKQREIN